MNKNIWIGVLGVTVVGLARVMGAIPAYWIGVPLTTRVPEWRSVAMSLTLTCPSTTRVPPPPPFR